MQYCVEVGCSALVKSGRCAEHQLPKVEDPIVHAWYRAARWLRLRNEVLRMQPFCLECALEGRRVMTAEIDHVIKHNGDPSLFWDRTNLQGLCKSHHSQKTRSGK